MLRLPMLAFYWLTLRTASEMGMLSVYNLAMRMDLRACMHPIDERLRTYIHKYNILYLLAKAWVPYALYFISSSIASLFCLPACLYGATIINIIIIHAAFIIRLA